ncbi:hypothetical protein M2139_001654 [Enterococcus sp. PF1-24]|nr:hypothetical protein [Enterococcus sp. PFB1-1]MDH6401768.1 hypothetical protein [Enterococcus sp. PF1-24]
MTQISEILIKEKPKHQMLTCRKKLIFLKIIVILCQRYFPK